MSHTVLLTGATGLIGSRVLATLLAESQVRRIYVLSRQPARIPLAQHERVTAIRGDLRDPAIALDGLSRHLRTWEPTIVIHCAASTSFAQTLLEARATNVEGTRRLLQLSSEVAPNARWIHVSTAFVVGSRTGVIVEADAAASDGFVNAYEQSKAEAELLVRSARPGAIIVRPSTVVCDDAGGAITQQNAVHRALRLYFGGLAAMLPGCDDTTVDGVTADYVAAGIVRLALADGIAGENFHLCSGASALPLDELLDVAHDVFNRSELWRRRGIARPIRTDLDTYRLFERAVEDTGRERVKQAVRSLGTFVPQLSFPKRFDTARADAVLGTPAPAMRDYWERVVATLAGGTAGVEAA